MQYGQIEQVLEEAQGSKMWDLLNVSIPAVVLLPVIAIGVVAWHCFQQTARSGDVRRAEFQRLQRLAMEEHERAERELEHDYMLHKQVDSRGEGVNFRGKGAPGYGYANDRVDRVDRVDRADIGLGEWRDPEAEGRRRQDEEKEQRRKLAEQAESRRKQAEQAEFRRKQVEDQELQRKHAEMEDRKRRLSDEDEMKRRQTEDHEWQRRRADIEAQAKRDAEEERSRQARVAEEEKLRRRKDEEPQKHEPMPSPRRAHPVSNLSCVVCQEPTSRRCSRCKSISYCSRACQVRHWNDGHKSDCRPHDNSSSPRSSVDGDTF